MYSVGYLLLWALSDICCVSIWLCLQVSRSPSLIRPLLHRAANPVAGKENLTKPQINRRLSLPQAKGQSSTHKRRLERCAFRVTVKSPQRGALYAPFMPSRLLGVSFHATSS